jgi:hypothetical protein
MYDGIHEENCKDQARISFSLSTNLLATFFYFLQSQCDPRGYEIRGFSFA